MRAVTLLAAVLGLAACKGDPVKCEAACRNYGTLTYWEAANKDIAAAPPEKRDALNKKYTAKFGEAMDDGVDLCTSQCSSANNEKTMNCMLAAKSAPEIRKCGAEPEEKK